MKRIVPILMLVSLPLLGCEAVEELLEFDVPISFAGDLEIVSETAVSDSNDAISVETDLATYRIDNDPDIAEYLAEGAEIKKIRVNRIRYNYKDFVGNEEAFLLEGGFSLVDASAMAIHTYPLPEQGTRIAEADFRNEFFILEDDFSALENGLSNSAGFIIGYYATLVNNPVDFKVGITVDVTVTIEPAL